ncbi:MAG TPA: C4-type zinc ribbon domain-containing protein [Acidimicrobiia bacterium]|nr:C4-type zinc ribbon domain-containing protein [Acidimicrobiia bacterium]
MSELDDLLSVQDHDSAIDRLRARRVKLPERQELAARQEEAEALEAQRAELQTQRDAAARDERHLDENVNALERRIAEVEQELYSGKNNIPRELQALQADIEQLKRQRSSMEDQELDAMERREGLDGEVAQLEEKVAAVTADIDRLTGVISEQEAAIDAELATETTERGSAAAKVSAELLKTYETIRAGNDGIGAARLVGGMCQGCHLALPAVEVDRIKKLPPGESIRCDQCGAILVRS